MKKTIVSIMAAMAIMASGAMAPSIYAHGMKDKARTSDSGMYQSGSSSSSSDLSQGNTSDSGMYPSGAASGSSNDMNQSGSYSSSDMTQGFGSFKFSEFMGKDVQGMNGDKLGTVKDFVVDPTGHVFALISREDMAGKTVAVPFEAFSNSGMKQDYLSLNISKDQLSNAPDFNQSSLADRTWSEGVYRHFGIQPRWSDQGMTGQTGTQGSYSYQGGSSQGSMSSPSGSTSDQGLKGTEQGTMGGQSSQPKTNY